jgi:hypothetical protein
MQEARSVSFNEKHTKMANEIYMKKDNKALSPLALNK